MSPEQRKRSVFNAKRSSDTASGLFLSFIPVILLIVFAFPRLHQDLHRFYRHGQQHASCPLGDENSSSGDAACAECSFSFFISVMPADTLVLPDVSYKLFSFNVIDNDVWNTSIIHPDHLRGPPEKFQV